MSDSYNLSITLLNEGVDFASLEVLNSEGLVGISEVLSPELVVRAYQGGSFPWYKFLKVYWWHSPDPRMVLFPDQLKISKSMRQVIRRKEFSLSANTAFKDVVEGCAKVSRRGQEGTWITREFIDTYTRLHTMGYAKSIEVWKDAELVGGLYGVVIGDVFFGESMFSIVPNASKRAFIALAQAEVLAPYRLIDCQVYTEHLESLGAHLIPRSEFLEHIKAE